MIDAFVRRAYLMREWVGPEVELAFDMHGKLTPALAVEICHEMQGMRPFFVEEPVPQENVAGYRDASPIAHAAGLRGRLLIVHGSGDDNVHYQGTERTVNKLVELGKQFDFMAYPNRSHCICEGRGTTEHVYQMLARYLIEHLPRGARVTS